MNKPITKPLHVLTRFAVSGILQLVLLYFGRALALPGGVNREVHLALEEGILAAIAIVVVFPILIRGDLVRRILSVVFIIFP